MKKKQLKEFLSLPINGEVVWQGGTFLFGSMIGKDFEADLLVEGPESSGQTVPDMAIQLAQTNMALWVSQAVEQVHATPDKTASPLEILVKALCQFADVQEIDYRPARLEVVDEQLAECLRELLGDCGTEVVFEPQAMFWHEVRDTMSEHFSDLTQKFPPLAESGCDHASIREYAEAAAAFYRSRIWRHLSDKDVLQLHGRGVPKQLKFATILGAGRQEYGIGFYASAQTHWDMYSQRADPRELEIGSMTFVNLTDADPIDVAMWGDLELPLEAGDAFPVFLFYSHDGARLPQPKELKFATKVMLALSDSSEEEIDSGKWKKSVNVSGKTSQQTISIPDLLDPPDQHVWMERGMTPDRRATDRFHGLISAYMSENEFEGFEEANEAIAKKFTESFDDFDYPNQTPRDKANNLFYEAVDNHGRRQIQIARHALELDPDHIGANNLLAEAEFDLDAKIDRFRRSVELGMAQSSELLNDPEAIGHFWGISETRPLMRAKYGLATALQADGQANEAVAELLDILRLNQNDNLGVRYEVVPILLSQNREAEAVEVLNRYSEETASWLYLKAQVEFRAGGPQSRSAAKAIKAAFHANPHVVELLFSPDPPLMPEHYALGSPEEAAIVIGEQLESWTETENFVPWMIKAFERFEQESAKRERSRRLDQRRKQRKKKSQRKKSRK